MTTPASAIKDEVRVLIDVQIETFRQPTPLTNSQIREYHYRSEKLKMLCLLYTSWRGGRHHCRNCQMTAESRRYNLVPR